ncbi:MAG: PAS domain S-box protein [Syntrophobacteraceae bacterium]
MNMQGHPIKVLLIDDDEDDYIVVRDLLSDISSIEFILKWVSNYEAALDAILSSEFDVCLLDYRLKERNGLELLQEAVSRSAMTPIVFLTGQGGYDLDLEAMSKGAADWLDKGELSSALLKRSIRYAIERQRKREELIKAKRVIQALSECNHAVINIEDEFELLRAICRIVVDVGGYRMAWVGYAEEDPDQTVTPVAKYGYEKDYLETVKVTWKDAERGRGPTGACIRKGFPSIFHSVGNQGEFARWQVEASKRGYASIIGLPLFLDGRRLGALTIYSSETDAFGSEATDFLVKLSGNLSHGIGVLRLRKARMQAEESLKEANLDLERRVDERTSELIKVNAELRREVEERRQAEEALRESEKRYKQLLQSVTDYIYTVQVQDNRPFVTVHGPGCAAVTGYTSEDYKADPYLWYRMVYEQDRDAVRDQADRVLSGEAALPLEHRIIHRDGSICWVSNTPVPHYDEQGELIAYDGMIANITARKMAEEALRESGVRLKIAMDLAKLVQWEYDVKTGMYSFDEQFYALYGTTSQHEGGALMTVEAYVRKFIPPEKSHVVAEAIAKTLATTDPNFTQQLEHRIIRADGEERHIIVRWGVICDQTGRVVKIRGANQDISDRKRAEKALEESEEKFRNLFNNAGVAMFRTMLDGSEILDINEKFLEIAGRTRAETQGTPSLTFWADPKERDAMVRRLVAKGRVSELEFKMLNKQGEVRDCITSLVLYREQGIVEGAIVDITERKQAEDSLRQSEEQFRTLVESAPDAIFIQVEGRFAYLNDVAARLYGAASVKELLSHAIVERIHPDHRAKVLERIRLINEERKPAPLTELKHVKLDGTTVYVESHSVPIRYQKSKGALVFVRDITERKKTEESLLLSEERYSRLFEDAVLGIFRSTPDGKLINVNPAYARMFGFDSPEEAKRQVNDVAVDLYVDPARRNEIVRMILDADGLIHSENLYRRKDGSIFTADLHVWTVHDTEGKLLYLEGFVEDISERKRAEEEKERLEAELRQAQKLEAIGTLAGGIAHDFNNILQPMMGYTEMALNELSPSSPLRDDLEQVLSSSLRAKELIRQILAISRSAPEQQRIPSDISSIIKEVLKLLRSSLPTSIEIRQNIRSGVALADPTQIHQVLMNLCTNAAHALDDNGILEVRLSPVNLSETDLADQLIVDLKPGPYLRLTVSDTGCGMDAGTMERIFDPYFTTKEVGKGSGLGLAVVNGIVNRHEGAITVRSEPGKGTTFSVYIPRVDVQSEVTMKVDDLLPQGPERILFVDDEPAVMKMVTRLLEPLGYKVTHQTDSVSALQVFRSNPDEFDLVITDYAMPILTGMDLAKEVRRIRPDMPIMLCTGFSEKITSDSVKKLGMELLMKPYSMREFSEVVRKILDARKGG